MALHICSIEFLTACVMSKVRDHTTCT